MRRWVRVTDTHRHRQRQRGGRAYLLVVGRREVDVRRDLRRLVVGEPAEEERDVAGRGRVGLRVAEVGLLGLGLRARAEDVGHRKT